MLWPPNTRQLTFSWCDCLYKLTVGDRVRGGITPGRCQSHEVGRHRYCNERTIQHFVWRGKHRKYRPTGLWMPTYNSPTYGRNRRLQTWRLVDRTSYRKMKWLTSNADHAASLVARSHKERVLLWCRLWPQCSKNPIQSQTTTSKQSFWSAKGAY